MSCNDNIFSFEFHSLFPISDCKNLIDADNSATLRLFGRTKQLQSVCVNVFGHLPYFYLCPNSCAEFNPQSPFGNENALSEIDISISSFKTSNIVKKPFYNYFEGAQQFLKVECCSDVIRKRLINFFKDSPSLHYTLYEVIFVFVKFQFDNILGTYFLRTAIHV